jgi:hypothetical protein
MKPFSLIFSVYLPVLGIAGLEACKDDPEDNPANFGARNDSAVSALTALVGISGQ